MSDYLKYRGKCKEMVDAAVAAEPSLRAVRGHYHCPIWGPQEHWWTEDSKGHIIDPSAKQFPSKGIGKYVEFDGFIPCAECGKVVSEEDARINGRYAFCSTQCNMRFVGL